jgi:hypothetical protein
MRPPLGITTKSDFVFTQPGPNSDISLRMRLAETEGTDDPLGSPGTLVDKPLCGGHVCCEIERGTASA